jgi:hypothetical protein
VFNQAPPGAIVDAVIPSICPDRKLKARRIASIARSSAQSDVGRSRYHGRARITKRAKFRCARPKSLTAYGEFETVLSAYRNPNTPAQQPARA